MSSRTIEWGLVVGGVVAVAMMHLSYREKPKDLGSETALEVTVVPSDEIDLGCSSDLVAEGHACAFDTSGRPRGQAARVIRPFVTVPGRLVLVGGLFEQSAVAQEVQRQRAANTNKRIIVKCDVNPIGEVCQTRVRWRANAAWDNIPCVFGFIARRCSTRPVQ